MKRHLYSFLFVYLFKGPLRRQTAMDLGGASDAFVKFKKVGAMKSQSHRSETSSLSPPSACPHADPPPAHCSLRPLGCLPPFPSPAAATVFPSVTP